MASKSAYEEAINSRVDRPAEMLAKYVDSQLRSGNKVRSLAAVGSQRLRPWYPGPPRGAHPALVSPTQGASDADIEKRLDEVMDLFRFISVRALRR